ncbi:hypothetical protein EHQ76_07285 [Leptospira barantonii]|uniref:Uncharacterized protein n=1 Tax=Leptospira barantonii TaxID=2023184 RepID=A0A5F2BL11_9LEPT|nr:hypothetical protein [Leptospira barantonii]TGM04840.1 hypothetical protein EHQ76_07285 [Leptospira barantonii]
MTLLEKLKFPFQFLRTGLFTSASLWSYKRTKFIFRNYWSLIFEEIPFFGFSVVKRNEQRPFDSARIALLGFEFVILLYKK